MSKNDITFKRCKYIFSYTFERVQENSEKLWRFERYTVINDYEWRIPSPINLVFLPYRMCCPNRDNCCIHMFKGKIGGSFRVFDDKLLYSL